MIYDFDETTVGSVVNGGVCQYIIKNRADSQWYSIATAMPSWINYDYIRISTDDIVCSLLSEQVLNSVLIDLIVLVVSRGRKVETSSLVYEKFLTQLDSKEYVRDILSFPYDGDISFEDDMMIRLCIEKPVRDSCVRLFEAGVKTLMSSANKKDVENKDVPVNEDKLFIGYNDRWVIGNGFAWILLDWDSLSEENKEYMLMLNNGQISLNLNEKEKTTFCANCKVNGVEEKQEELVKFYEYVEVEESEANLSDSDSCEIVKNMAVPDLSIDSMCDEEYDQSKVYLLGKNSLSNVGKHLRTVAIRYPVDESTKCEEVERFFSPIVAKLCTQQKSCNLTNDNNLGNVGLK